MAICQTGRGEALQLSDKERKILGAIEHQAEVPVSELQKQTKLRAHSIHYAIASLKRRGIIVGKAPFINNYPLGYTDYTIYFSLSSTSKRSTNKLISRLIAAPGVSWVAQLGGDFQIGVAFCARRIEEVSFLLGELSEEFGQLFFQKSISVRISFHAFGRKYLWKRSQNIAPLKIGKLPSSVEINEVDHTILSGLANNEYSSKRELSRLLAIPFSTLERRVGRLEESGVIGGYIYRLNLSGSNLLTYRLLIYSRGIAPMLTQQLYTFCKKHPGVLHFIECMGAWDYEIGVEISHAEELNEIIQALQESVGDGLIGIKSLQIFKHLKYSGYPFP